MLDELVRYVGFGDEDAELLAEARPLVEPSFQEVVDAFYAAIEANARARAVFSRPVPFQIGGDRVGWRSEVDYVLAPEQVDLLDWNALG